MSDITLTVSAPGPTVELTADAPGAVTVTVNEGGGVSTHAELPDLSTSGHPVSAITGALSAAAAAAAYQPLDSDLTAVAALTAPATSITNAVPKTLVDAAGDLLVGSAADTVARLAMGTASQVLRVNSGATGLEWAAASGGGTAVKPGPILATGSWATVPGTLTTRATTVNYCWLIPFPIERDCTLTRLAVNVTGTAASTAIRLGLYSDSNGLPGSVLLDAGTVDPSGTGLKEITVSQAVTAGRVWFAIHPTGSNTPTLGGFVSGIMVPDSTANPVSSGWTGDHYVAFYMASSDSAALPAVYTADGSTTPAPRPLVKVS